MSLAIGIVGLPNVGKSTLFTALTKKQVEIANYPFATIDPNVGVVAVPDERLTKLAEISHSKETIPTVVEFVDIAGLVKGANKGEGLGNQFLTHIREVDAVLYMVRAFEGTDIQHVEQSIDPVRDFDIIRTELALKDLEAVERRLERARKDSKTGDKDKLRELAVLEQWFAALEEGTHLREVLEGTQDDTNRALLRELQLLTAKPAMAVVNTRGEEVPGALSEVFEQLRIECVPLNAREELDGADLSPEERAELGLGESALPRLIQAAYTTLNLITFFTTGEKETRAWTVKKGSTAPQAAGVIHTDFEHKFIRAEVIQWDKLLEAEGWTQARGKGLIRTEGKGYILKDGDVIVVLHSA
ncbi:MAG: redox-regulated ATPase YchF [Candidatus Spechtbacterales bacterium]